MDEQSGFNLLQAAVFEEKYNIVLEASGLFVNLVEEMELTKTGKTVKEFIGKTAVDFLSLRKRTNPFHFHIEKIYEKLAEDKSGLTELQWGTCNDDAEQAVELVLNDCVDINASGSDNDLTALLQASRSSSSQFIETLIDPGADVNAQRRESKETPLMVAADWNNYMAASLIVRHGADVNVHVSNGSTPLHVSVNKDHENLFRLLLKHNADVNTQDKGKGYTPLHLSAREGNENLCRLLLEHNADVNIQDKSGNTLLHLSVRKGDDNLCRLLLEHNADVNIQDKSGNTPLHLSARKGDENLCRLLLEHNADVNIRDYSGYTMLHLLVRGPYMFDGKIIDLLAKYRAQNIDIRDARGMSPLQVAVRWGKAQAVKKLVDHGADVSVVEADETDARRLKSLKNKAEKMEQHLKVEMGSAQKGKEPKHKTGVAFVQGAEKITASHPKSEKILRQTPSSTYTTK